MSMTPIILATEGADNAPGRPVYTCRGCPRRLCHPGYCATHCRSAHAKRLRKISAHNPRRRP